MSDDGLVVGAGPDEVLAAHHELIRNRKRLTEIRGRDVFVGCIDLLGFRSLVRREPKQTFERYQVARRWAHDASVEPEMEYGNPGFIVDRNNPLVLYPKTFSDSTFFVTTSSSSTAQTQIQDAVNKYFRQLLQQKLPSRGAIAKGTVWWSPRDDVFMGPGITNAWELVEKMRGIGVVLAPDLPPAANSSPAVAVPMKAGGYVELRAPVLNAENGIVYFFGPELRIYSQLQEAAAKDGDLDVLSKYQESRSLVEIMLRTNCEEHLS